jgi:putative aldouronate transport system substrate-binding protein
VIPKARVRTEEQLKELLGVLDKWNTREAEVTMSNGIEGQSFTVEDGYAVPAAASPDNELIQRTIKTYVQLRMNVNGPRVYEQKQPTEAQQALLDKRFAIWKEDLKSAVYNPAAPYVSDTYVSKGAQLDNIIADARIKFIAGQLDEQGLRGAIKLWESSGGAQVIEETNALYRENQ